MNTAVTSNIDVDNFLSFKPLVNVLKKMIAEGKPGARKFYKGLLQEIEEKPELLQPLKDTTLVEENKELIEALLSTIFPPSTSSNQGLYAITFPFSLETIYSSKGFKEIFLGGGSQIKIGESNTNIDVKNATTSLAYNVILNKLYAIQVPIIGTSVHSFTDGETGLKKYYELKLNAQFIDVKCTRSDFSLPTDFTLQHVIEPDALKATIPLEYFQFEGIVIVDVNDVTDAQIISELKNILLQLNAFSDVTIYDELQQHVESLLKLKDIKIGITPFFKKNNFSLYTEAHYKNSLLFKNENVIQQKEKISRLFQSFFHQSSSSILYETLSESKKRHNDLLKFYVEQGANSLILCPLKCEDGELIGLLEILSQNESTLEQQHLSKIGSVVELFTTALEKTSENLELQIDKTIKEHFTAIQPSVEWKFTEASFNYLQDRLVNENSGMPSIAFNDVYPLYGSIDIRNSSVERSNSIQLDLMEQLTLAQDVITKAGNIIKFPLLKEAQYRIEKYLTAASETLLSDDEMQIYEFLQDHLDSLLRNLLELKPELKKVILNYFNQLDSQRNVIYHHRKNYEDSITRINDVLDRFMDKEQHFAQEIYPHYFERYITDGLEFNIYVGQSIAPSKSFNEMYVRNLKLWQLTFLAKAARLTNALEKRLPLPLQTTQLILAHAIPLSISFRKKERKFDVDGAYNIRYEIIKKRIDKVHIRDSEERLTQPGKIAIVYSQQKEMMEYVEYIEFLQHENLLGDNVEHHELEDTQGISGLKAIRVDINFPSEINGSVKESVAKENNIKEMTKETPVGIQ